MSTAPPLLPQLSSQGLSPTHAVSAVDELGQTREVHVAGEQPLTLKVDDREVVTLMTLGTHPEALALGYLRNQRLIDSVEEIASVTVDWDFETVDVHTRSGAGIVDWEEKLSKRTVTTGCAQGTVFSCTLDKIYDVKLPPVTVRQSLIYELLREISRHNEIYKQAGAVHGCALCQGTRILSFVEDVGRHNAADAISGQMWLEGIEGHDKIFYTTGRLTSEIVMKVTQMGIPVLLSRSGVTYMGLELAEVTGVTMIARAKGRHFLVYHGQEHIIFDAPPEPRSTPAREARGAGPRRVRAGALGRATPPDDDE
jgi:FdhD protein